MKKNKKTWKKVLSLCLACLMILSVFVGCSNNGKDPGASKNEANGNSNDPSASVDGTGGSSKNLTISGEGTGDVVMTYITMLTEPADLALVESAISEKTNSDLGITVDFYPLSILEQSKYTTIIGGGDTLDLMCIAYTDPTAFSAAGMIKKLTEDDIREYAPDIAAMVDEGTPLYIYDPEGNIIAISTKEITNGYGGSYVVRKSDLEAAGLAEDYPDQTLISYEDLDLIFSKLKALYPDSYPCGNLSDVSERFFAADPLGGYAYKQYGVLDLEASLTDTTLVNYYETEEYKEYLSWMQKWYDAGYVYPDALTTSDNEINLFASGKCRGKFLDGWAHLRDEYTGRCGEEVIQLQLMEPFEMPLSAGSGICWCVCGTSKNPAGALRLLNAFTTDQDLMNLYQWGIEGTHYEFVDKEAGVIDYADGLDASTSGFYNSLLMIGDKNKIYSLLNVGQTVDDVKATNALMLQIREKAEQKPTPVKGFSWDSSNVQAEIAAVDNVIAQYAASIGIGQNKNYDEFISALKDAGIDKIIADKQAQLDAYLKSQGN